MLSLFPHTTRLCLLFKNYLPLEVIADNLFSFFFFLSPQQERVSIWKREANLTPTWILFSRPVKFSPRIDLTLPPSLSCYFYFLYSWIRLKTKNRYIGFLWVNTFLSDKRRENLFAWNSAWTWKSRKHLNANLKIFSATLRRY